MINPRSRIGNSDCSAIGVALICLLGCEGTQREFSLQPGASSTDEPRGASGSAGTGNEARSSNGSEIPPAPSLDPANLPSNSAEASRSEADMCVAADAGGCAPIALCEGDAGGMCERTCPGCFIEGECVAADAVDPLNSCQLCDPQRDAQAWSPRDGVSCDDGLFCTTEDVCKASVCAGGPRECEDGIACNGVSSCDETAAKCTDDVNQCGANALCNVQTGLCISTCTGCIINGVCLTVGTEASGNPCLVCDPTRSPTAFSGAAGKSCGAGATACSQQDTCNEQGQCQPNHLPANASCGSAASGPCDQPDTCDGNGNCQQRVVSNGTPCDDGAFCTTGDQCQGGQCVPTSQQNCGANRTCNEAADQCQCPGCSINGTCVAQGTPNTNNRCEVCDITRNANTFSTSTAADCRKADGADCTGPTECAGNQCVLFYGDDDGDGFAPQSALASAGMFCTRPNGTLPKLTRQRPTSRGTTDCLDTNGDVRPNQTTFFFNGVVGLTPSFDYNCDGLETDGFNNRLSNCNDAGLACVDRGGWGSTGVPQCGSQETGIGGVSPCGLNELNNCVPFPGGPGNRGCR